MSELARALSVLSLFAACTATTFVADAHAQTTTEASPEASPETRERARAAFIAGTTAIDEGRWADAVDLFRDAYALTGSPVALFNLGYAYRALGRFVEARDAFDAVLSGELDEAGRTEAQGLRDEVAGRVATLELSGVEDGVSEVRIDARELDDAPPLVLELDPGPHTATVHVTGFLPWEWAGELAPGSRTSVTVELVPLLVVESGSNLAEEPWLWIVIGALVLGGAAVAVWAVDDSQQLRPEGPVLRL